MGRPHSQTATRGRTIRPRILLITPELPYRSVPHAGGQYLWHLTEALQGMANVIVVSRPTPSNDKATNDPVDLPINTVIARPKGWGGHRLHDLARRLQDLLYRFDPTCPDLPFITTLILDHELRGLIRGADVIDLQWAEYGRLWPVLRLLSPHARLIGTSHDVIFQRLRRVADTRSGHLRQARWRLGAWISQRWEIGSCQHLDTTIVFSDKDRKLLVEAAGPTSCVTVVDPPLAPPAIGPRHPAEVPTAVMVGYFGRPENVDAATWLLSEVWPAVRAACSEVQLRLVGADPKGRLTPLAGAVANVSVTGFVDDLWDEYAGATLTVVPLRAGAGVKFKTVESLLAGTPVVATTVGAEGIGGEEILTAVTDDPRDFAQAVIDVLRDSAAAETKAEAAQAWAQERYGLERFLRTVRSLYVGPAHVWERQAG